MSGSVSSAVELRARVVAAAKNAMIASADADYTPNGRTVEGFDCSGFVCETLLEATAPALPDTTYCEGWPPERFSLQKASLGRRS
jgi:hypothetical protein